MPTPTTSGPRFSLLPVAALILTAAALPPDTHAAKRESCRRHQRHSFAVRDHPTQLTLRPAGLEPGAFRQSGSTAVATPN